MTFQFLPMECYKSQQGVQALEVIISMALFAILVVAVFVLFGSSITESNGLLKQARANTLLQEALDGARFIGSSDWASLAVGQHGLNYVNGSWSFSGDTDVTDGTFFRTVTIQEIDTSTKDVVIEVYWNYWGRLISRSATTRLTNWQNVEVWGNWGFRSSLGHWTLDRKGKRRVLLAKGILLS